MILTFNLLSLLSFFFFWFALTIQEPAKLIRTKCKLTETDRIAACPYCQPRSPPQPRSQLPLGTGGCTHLAPALDDQPHENVNIGADFVQ